MHFTLRCIKLVSLSDPILFQDSFSIFTIRKYLIPLACQSHTGIDYFCRCFYISQLCRSLFHLPQLLLICQKIINDAKQLLAVKLMFVNYHRRTRTSQSLGIFCLMVICCPWIRDENSRFTRCRNFRKRGGSGTADDQIGCRISIGHIDNEWHHLCIQSKLFISPFYGFYFPISRLMKHT